MNAPMIPLCFLLATSVSCATLMMSTKDRVKTKFRDKHEVAAEWTDKAGYDQFLTRETGRLNQYWIRESPYVEPQWIGFIDLKKGTCTWIIRTDGSGWERSAVGKYRYQSSTALNHVPVDCKKAYGDTSAWPVVAEAIGLSVPPSEPHAEAKATR